MLVVSWDLGFGLTSLSCWLILNLLALRVYASFYVCLGWSNKLKSDTQTTLSQLSALTSLLWAGRSQITYLSSSHRLPLQRDCCDAQGMAEASLQLCPDGDGELLEPCARQHGRMGPSRAAAVVAMMRRVLAPSLSHAPVISKTSGRRWMPHVGRAVWVSLRGPVIASR